MGLDFVELVLRTEEVFAVALPDEECGRIQTVGDLYALLLEKFELPYVPSSEIELKFTGATVFLGRPLKLCKWTTPDVWLTLKGVIQERLGVDASRITEAATFQDDLRCS